LGYLGLILSHSNDRKLDAGIWLMSLVGALRLEEARGTTVDQVVLSEPALRGRGKGNKSYELFMHEPLLRWLLDLSASRPWHSPIAILLRTERGGKVPLRRFEDWSDLGHDRLDWMRGHNWRHHIIRHTAAQEADERVGDPVAVTCYLRQSLKNQHGVTGVYLRHRIQDEAATRRRVVEAEFGPLTSWPVCPENRLLQGLLGDGPWSSAP
jgi:integrase